MRSSRSAGSSREAPEVPPRRGAATLVRSMAHNMTVLQKYRGAMMDTITEFVIKPDMSSKDAANAMADAVEAQK